MARKSRKKSVVVGPQVDPVVLEELWSGDRYDLEPHADLEGIEIVDGAIDDVDLSHATFYGSRLANVRIGDAQARGLSLRESVLERVDIPVFRGIQSDWRDVEVCNARIGSAELYDSEWQSVHFVGCKLGFVNLRGAQMQDVAFTDCTIDDLDLVQATATRVAFRSCRIGSLDVQASKLKHFDLRQAELQEFHGSKFLSGTVIDSAQLVLFAPIFANTLGVTVED